MVAIVRSLETASLVDDLGGSAVDVLCELAHDMDRADLIGNWLVYVLKRNKTSSRAFLVSQIPWNLHQEWWQKSNSVAILANGLVIGVVVAADGDHKIGVSLEGCSVGIEYCPVLR
jgi:hypothetical protein